ncbi:MAG: hypothetical protein HYV18_01155 [Gammaproteobacteria bacterium]|nr:hypothetical protein [Gammaproteobacteria bacterium]
MHLMKAKKLLPQISDTEKQALQAGSVWIDGDIFGGNPDFKKMLAEAYNRLTPEFFPHAADKPHAIVAGLPSKRAANA